jgi:hypothetical protein
MSSRKTMKRITTKNKKKPLFDNSHLETKEEPDTSETKHNTSETKEEPETIEIKEEILMSEKLKPNDKYLCTTCNMVLLYKNYDRHTKTQTHIKKFI